MADGLCTGDPVGNVIEKTIVQNYGNVIMCEENDSVNGVACDPVNAFYIASESDKLFDKLCVTTDGSKHEGFLSCEDDCRKKRCVDRYDSSESSDSGVAVLSCTDCSGSSTASSDITDPGSPFSTASSHSEDSGSQPAKMPPTQTAHHPPWPWTAEEGPPPPPVKRALHEKTAFPKRLKTSKSPPCLNNTSQKIIKSVQLLNKNNNNNKNTSADASPNDKLVNLNLNINNNNTKCKGKIELTPKMQQGKITEYFKSQIKGNVVLTKSKELSKPVVVSKIVSSLVDKQMQLKAQNIRKVFPVVRKIAVETKARKLSPVSVPRKILPAPSKIPDKMTINNHVNSLTNFTPTVTLTAVSFPSNLTYLHTKTPKPPDNIYVPQFGPILNRTPCLNVMQPVQKIATINNFNCVKLNATVVPIVKLNTLPSRLNGSSNLTLSVETGLPTVLSAKPKVHESISIAATAAVSTNLITTTTTPKQHGTPKSTVVQVVVDNVQSKCQQVEEKAEICRNQEKSPTPDSDSGISNKDCLEVCVRADGPVLVEQQKSPILSQPKTIRFPAKKQDVKDDSKDSKSAHSPDGLCRWADCNAQFDTSGALLEHLQVKHVISQATQEHFVCLWLGCKVHGRTSCSRTWLERHVLAHAGTKPFRCIVDGCGQRFNSQLMLERHVNGHFNADGSQNTSAKKSTENGPTKLFKRNGKRIRFRRQPWSARMFDFIDNGIMEGLQHKLLMMTQKRTSGQIGNAGDTVNLNSQILAKRIESDGSTKFLLKWHPAEIIPDEWVTEKEYKATKTVSIPRLQVSAKNALKPNLFPPKSVLEEGGTRQKHRRKPISKQQT